MRKPSVFFKSQCNDAYWHGVFGGLYLPHLRTEVYRNLIEAENLTTIEHAFASAPSITVADMDADGFDEAIIRNREEPLFVSPRNGGSLVELDYKPRAVISPIRCQGGSRAITTSLKKEG